MGMEPLDRNFGFRINTSVKGIALKRSFLAHFSVDGDNAPAASANGVLAMTSLNEEAQEISDGITNPAVPRSLSIVGSELNMAGNVVITGKNYAGEEITETIALNAKTTVNGSLAFKEITQIDLPAETNTPQEQTKTIEVTAACSADGDLTATIASVLFEGGEAEVVIAVTDTMTTATLVAAAVVEALNDDETFSEYFTASNDGATITITANEPDSDDDTLDIEFAVGETGVTFGASADGDAGILDKVSIGWGDKLGLPYKSSHNTVMAAYLNNVKESTAPTVSVDDDEIDKNTILLNSALNGTVVDVYLIV